MLQEMVQVPVKNLTAVEVGGAVVLAMYIVDKIMGWIYKFKGKETTTTTVTGNGNGKGVVSEKVTELSATFDAFQGTVGKIHEKQCATLENQTLVLDRIYQGQALQIKALDKIVEKLN